MISTVFQKISHRAVEALLSVLLINLPTPPQKKRGRNHEINNNFNLFYNRQLIKLFFLTLVLISWGFRPCFGSAFAQAKPTPDEENKEKTLYAIVGAIQELPQGDTEILIDKGIEDGLYKSITGILFLKINQSFEFEVLRSNLNSSNLYLYTKHIKEVLPLENGDRIFIRFSKIKNVENPSALPAASHDERRNADIKKDIEEDVKPKRNKYLIGPGDVLTLSTWPEGLLPKQANVRDDGTLLLPLSDPILVAGMDAWEVEDAIREAIGDYYQSFWIQVAVLESVNNTIQISQLKDKGGMEALRFPYLQNIWLSEFFLKNKIRFDNGDFSNIQIVSLDGATHTVNLHAALQNPRGEKDWALQPNDSILIQEAEDSEPVENVRIYTLGKVNSPGAVSSPGAMSALRALSEAKGLAEGADAEHASIIRQTAEGPKATPIDLGRLIKGELDDSTMIGDGDVLYIPPLPPPSPPAPPKKRSFERINQAINDVLPTINLIFILNNI